MGGTGLKLDAGRCIHLDSGAEGADRFRLDRVVHVHATALLRDETGFLERLEVMTDRRLRQPDSGRQIAGAGFLIRLIEHERDQAKPGGISQSFQTHGKTQRVIHGKVGGR